MTNTAPSSTSSTPANTPPTSANGAIFNHFLRRSNAEFDKLLIACQKNDVVQVRKLLEEDHVDPSHANPAGQSALHIAAWWGHADCLDLLLQHGANLHAKNSLTSATPLHCCLQSGKAKGDKLRYLTCLEKLLQAGADPQAKDDKGRTPLEYLEPNETYRQEVLQLFESMKHAHSPFRDLLKALHNKEDGNKSLEAVQSEWIDLTCDDGVMGTKDSDDYQEGMQHLRSVLLVEMYSLVEEWVGEVENADHDDEMVTKDVNHCFYVQRVTWLWERLVESYKDAEEGQDQLGIISMPLRSAQKKCLDCLGIAILHRYGRVHKLATCSDSLLDQDAAMSYWAKVASILAMTKDSLCNTDKSTTTGNDTIEQAWMTIARRNYFALAKLWRDKLGIDPVQLRNAQGMSVLQFAARSGHVHLVQWLLDESATKDTQESKRLLAWVQQEDNLGQTPLSAAMINENDETARVLQAFIDKASS